MIVGHEITHGFDKQGRIATETSEIDSDAFGRRVVNRTLEWNLWIVIMRELGYIVTFHGVLFFFLFTRSMSLLFY